MSTIHPCGWLCRQSALSCAASVGWPAAPVYPAIVCMEPDTELTHVQLSTRTTNSSSLAASDLQERCYLWSCSSVFGAPPIV